MEFDAYTLDDGVYDEMFQAGDTPHPHCRNLREWLDRLSAEEINGIQEWVTRSFLNEGITFTVYGENEADERIIPIDCLPRIVSAGDWRQIESGLTQRILALNRFLADVYGAGRIVDDGVIPADMVYGCPQYRREMRGVQPAHGTWVSICGTDEKSISAGTGSTAVSAGRSPAPTASWSAAETTTCWSIRSHSRTTSRSSARTSIPSGAVSRSAARTRGRCAITSAPKSGPI